MYYMTKRLVLPTWVLGLLFVLFTGSAFGQVNYVSWDFSPSITNANYATNFTNQTGARTSALTSPTLSTLTTVGGTGATANTFHRSTGWPAASSTSNYLEFSVTLAAGQTFNNSTLSFATSAEVSSTTTAARNYTVTYGWGASPTFANATNGAVTAVTAAGGTNTATIPAPGNTTSTRLTIRILVFGNTGGGNMRFRTLALTGASAPAITPTTAPEINVKQSATNLTSGSGTYTYSPSVNVGSSSSAVTFTIENTGDAVLNLDGTPNKIAISGHTSDFTINQTSTSATVAITNGTTTFTVAFNPTAGGTRSAVISIASDDADEDPYTFTVTGTGVSLTPTLGVNPTSIAFGTVTTNNTSSQNFFTLTSSNLTGNVTVTPPSGFEVGTTSGGPYSASAITLTPAQAASVPVYVVFKPTAAIAYSGNITVSGGGATTANVAVTGTGIAPCAAPANQATNLVFGTITAGSIGGSFTPASGGATGYLVLASTSATAPTNPTNGSTYTTIGGAYNGNTIIAANTTGSSFTAGSLAANTPYYFYIYAYNNTTCSGGPVYRTPALTNNATTLNAPIAIATYTFTGAVGNEATLPADLPQPIGVNAGVVDRQGIVSAVSAANTFGTANWQTSGGAIDVSRYIDFTIAPTAGYTLTLTDFSFQDQISGSGPISFALRSSKDNYAANIFSGSTNATITDPAHVTTLTGFTTLSAGTTFRIYGYGASAAGGTWRLDNIIINGFIDAGPPTLVVNPTSLAFGNVNINATSTQQSFDVTGYNLTNNVVLSVPAGYQFSTTSGSGYTSSNITLTAAQATAGTTIYVVFKPIAATTYPASITMTSTGVTTPPSVALTGTGVVPPPTITASTTGTLAFGNVNINTTSAQQSYTIEGVNLTANLVVTAPTRFAVSTVSGGPYTSSVSLAPTSGTVNTTTIYVVYQPIANGASSGNVTNASTSATTRNIAVSGTGVTPCVAPANQATNLTFPSIVGTTINGSFTAAVGGADGYLVLRSTNSTLSTGPVDGVAYTLGGTLGGGTVVGNTSSITFSTSGSPTTTYYFFVYAFNNTGCVGGPLYKKPSLNGNATTLTAPYTAFDNFDRGSNTTTAGIPSSGGSTAWTEIEGAAARVAIFNNKLVINSGSPAGADAASFNMTGKYATTYNNAQGDLVWVFNMASTRSNPSGFLSTSSTYGTAVVLGGTNADITDAGDGYAVILGNSSSPDYVKIVRYTGGLMNPTNNANLTDIVSYTANSADQEILNVKVEYSPTTKIWKLYVNEPGGTASYNTSGLQPNFSFPDPTVATYATAASSSADNNALLNSALPFSGFLFNHGTVTDEYATFDNFNIPTAQPCQPTWTGNTSTNWFVGSNWSCGLVPTSADDVVIPNVSAGSNNYPVINASLSTTAAVNNIIIASGASVTINANFIGGFPVSTNDLEIHGNLTNNGVANWGTGTVNFTGTATQSISGNNNFQYLTIENNVTLASGTQKVLGTLALKAGTLATNGRLTIASSATYTGMIDEFTTGYTGGITGNITVQRYANNTASSFFYIGSPVGGAQISDWGGEFSLATMNGATDGSQVLPTSTCSPTNLQAGSPYGGLFDYRENAINTCNLEGWHVRTTGGIPAAKGFIGRVPVGTVIDLTGTFVADVTVTSPTLTRSVNASGRPAGMNLVANPFAAPVDWSAVYAANTANVTGTAHFYQTSGPLAGTYVAVNNTLGGQEIGTSQAFIVQALNNGATISFTDGMKRNGENQYLRTGPAYEQLLTLDVTGNGYADRAYVAFGAAFTAGFDVEFDGRKLQGKPEQPSLYVNDGNDQYSIYAQPSVAQVQIVPVDFTAGTNGNFAITADLTSFDPTAMIFLEDRLTGTMTNLRLNGTYNFNATVNEAAGRFALHFFPAMEVVAENATCAGLDGAINLNQPGTTEWNGTLNDANGNTVLALNNFNGTQAVSNLSPGVYTLNLEHASGYTVNLNYLVEGPAPVVANFTAPILATEGDNVSFTNLAVNATTYAWSFGDGSTSTDANPVHAYAFPGEYLVEMVASNGDCQQNFTQLITVQEKVASGINETLAGKVKIYAVGTDIHLQLADLTAVSTVDVFNLVGQKVIVTTKLNQLNGAFVISLQNAANGYYFVRMVNGQDIFIEKVLISSGN